MKSSKLLSFIKNENGATAIEYGLITALIAVAIIGTVGAVGSQLDSNYTDIGNKMQEANTTP